jgi:hypothetical protein
MADTGAALRKLAEATDPLYKSLDDGQKRRFEILGRFARFGRHHFHGRHHDGYRERDDDDDDEFRGRDYDRPHRHWRRGEMDRMEGETSGRRPL